LHSLGRLLHSGYLWVFPLGVRRPKHGVGHWIPSTEVKDACSYTSTLPYFLIQWCLPTNKDTIKVITYLVIIFMVFPSRTNEILTNIFKYIFLCYVNFIPASNYSELLAKTEACWAHWRISAPEKQCIRNFRKIKQIDVFCWSRVVCRDMSVSALNRIAIAGRILIKFHVTDFQKMTVQLTLVIHGGCFPAKRHALINA
jgi:hypothetical protein